MEQQSAVEWLHDNLTKIWYDVKSSKELLEKAKIMAEKEKTKAYMKGMRDAFKIVCETDI